MVSFMSAAPIKSWLRPVWSFQKDTMISFFPPPGRRRGTKQLKGEKEKGCWKSGLLTTTGNGKWEALKSTVFGVSACVFSSVLQPPRCFWPMIVSFVVSLKIYIYKSPHKTRVEAASLWRGKKWRFGGGQTARPPGAVFPANVKFLTS